MLAASTIDQKRHNAKPNRRAVRHCLITVPPYQRPTIPLHFQKVLCVHSLRPEKWVIPAWEPYVAFNYRPILYANLGFNTNQQLIYQCG
jgi:hypothetical protein